MLLTGASGFVGSHILDSLRERNVSTAILLRNTSRTSFLERHLPKVEVRPGSVGEPECLRNAVKGITHVIHCAGCTSAVRASQFYEANDLGTRNLVRAANTQASSIQRFLQISSLAVSGPATAGNPALEEQTPRPVSVYGKSKLAAETGLRAESKVPYTIIRPPAVYGPRDKAFLSMFKAVKYHLLPQPTKRQDLSLVYVEDLAEVIVSCLVNPAAAGQTYFAASPEIVTGRSLAKEIALQMERWTVPCPLPKPVLWLACLAQEILARLSGKARMLNLQKFTELRAAGWVCSPAKLLRETGLSCGTTLKQGIAQSLKWYLGEHWL